MPVFSTALANVGAAAAAKQNAAYGPIRRQRSFPFCGRLIAMPTSDALIADQHLDMLDEISIDFPSMPDTIELARKADYAVYTNVVLPDGIHMYRGTSPLEIPFSFKLHAFDEEFCPDGALTLLRVTARLHSFAIPLTDDQQQSIRSGINSNKAGEETASGQEFMQRQRASEAVGKGELTTNFSGYVRTFNPVTCVLELMYTEAELPGISCVGYVKDVSAKLNGPWLRGPGKSYNLPSSADFSFTFVHRPGHANVFETDPILSKLGSSQPQAYANYVAEHLYNTRALAKIANYRGFLSKTPQTLKDAQGQADPPAASSPPDPDADTQARDTAVNDTFIIMSDNLTRSETNSPRNEFRGPLSEDQKAFLGGGIAPDAAPKPKEGYWIITRP